jgi:hypothetical protein
MMETCLSRVTGSSPALALVLIIPFDLIFLLVSFFKVARIARADELALWPDGGFYVLVVTLLTSMKLIIALLVQEVKRYVVISLILFRNVLIENENIELTTHFFWCFLVRFHHSIMPLKDVLTYCGCMR